MLTTPTQFFADREVAEAPPPAAPPAQRKPRQGYTLLGAALAVMIGWGVSGLGSAAVPGLLVRTEEGLTVLDAEGVVVLTAPGGQVSPDGGVVVHAETLGTTRTRVVASDAATGAMRWNSEVSGQYEVRLVTEGGTAAVLGPPRTDGISPYLPEGRSTTRMTVVSQAGWREYRLDGNFEPEAVSLDATSIFVIQYTPPLAPQSYQVRRLDLAAGEVVDVFTPDEELQQEMGGTARTQVASADGRRLYTLYTLASGDGAHSQAFIHVLDLDEQWAHCIDLPAEFTGIGDSTALALSPDGRRLYAADRAGGMVAAIDTESLDTVTTAALSVGQELDPVEAAVGPTVVGLGVRSRHGDLFVSAGRRIELLDATTLQPVRSFRMKRLVTALEPQTDGTLAVGLDHRIVRFDPIADAVVDTHPWADQPPIIGLGTAPGRVLGPREGIDCAC